LKICASIARPNAKPQNVLRYAKPTIVNNWNKEMKNILILLIVLQIFSSCNDPKQQEEKTSEFEVKTYSWQDYPNENTEIKIFKTKSTIDDKDLMTQLQEIFKKDKFTIESEQIGNESSFANCADNITLLFKGNGIKHYYLKRTEAEPKNYYPDFRMSIFEFKTVGETRAIEKEIIKGFGLGNGFCNGKEPNYIVTYKNKIIHLTTRAEMFRGYIKKVAEEIEKLND
jgi:hypothetical protein